MSSLLGMPFSSLPCLADDSYDTSSRKPPMALAHLSRGLSASHWTHSFEGTTTLCSTSFFFLNFRISCILPYSKLSLATHSTHISEYMSVSISQFIPPHPPPPPLSPLASIHLYGKTILDQWFSTLILHQNQTKGWWKQRLLGQSVWFGTSGVGHENLHFLHVHSSCCCCWPQESHLEHLWFRACALRREVYSPLHRLQHLSLKSLSHGKRNQITRCNTKDFPRLCVLTTRQQRWPSWKCDGSLRAGSAVTTNVAGKTRGPCPRSRRPLVPTAQLCTWSCEWTVGRRDLFSPLDFVHVTTRGNVLKPSSDPPPG